MTNNSVLTVVLVVVIVTEVDTGIGGEFSVMITGTDGIGE